MNGYPQLTKLEFILDFLDYNLNDKATFLDYIEAIHGGNCQIISSRKRGT